MDGDKRVSFASTKCSFDSSPFALVSAPEYTHEYEPSETTTSCEKNDFCDTHSCSHDHDTEAYDDHTKPFGRSVWALWDDVSINKEEYKSAPAPPKLLPSLRKFRLKAILSSFFMLISDYKTRKRLSAAKLRVEQCRKNYHPLSVGELQSLYEYLRQLEHHRKKFAFAALTLRLSVLEFLFDILDTPVLFSEQRKTFLREVWLDLDHESPIYLKIDIRQQIIQLKQRIFMRVLDELPVNRSISEIIPNGSSVVQPLCEELAYGSGVYAVQKALTQISQTVWGHRELLRLSLQPSYSKGKGKEGSLILDCVVRLLSFRNAFSHAMTFRIFGRLAEFNDEIHALLAGPMGVCWLIGRLNEQSYRRRTRYRSYRQIEIYCRALTTGCYIKGLLTYVLEHEIVHTLLHVVEMFTKRDEAMHSAIEDDQQDDCNIELDQIACCELIILLMKTPSGKKQFFSAPGGIEVLKSFMDDPNRSFSDWKLSFKLKLLGKLLQ